MLRRRQRSAEAQVQDVREADDRIQWRAKLVAHRVQELSLRVRGTASPSSRARSRPARRCARVLDSRVEKPSLTFAAVRASSTPKSLDPRRVEVEAGGVELFDRLRDLWNGQLGKRDWRAIRSETSLGQVRRVKASGIGTPPHWIWLSLYLKYR